jgi:multiple sugar transport system substrate-binding protein
MKGKVFQCAIVAAVLFSLFWAGPLLASEKGKIHILFMEPFPANVEQAQKNIDDFKKQNPGIEFNLEPLGFGGFLQKITALKAAGNPPDIIYTIPGHLWTFQREGWLEPMDDVIAEIGGDKYFQPLPGYVKKDGHYWGVPWSSYSLHLEYRKDLLAQKGLKEPRTWDDLLKAAKALTEDTDGDGKIDRYGIALPLKKEYVTGVFFLSFLWGNGGHVLDKNGNVVFNSPETIQTLAYLKELYKYAPPGVSGYGWMELLTTYVQDKVAITGFSALKPLDDAIKANPKIAANTGIGPIPTRLVSQEPKARWANMSWMITKDSKNNEVAKKFLAQWFEPERSIKFYHVKPVFVVPGEYPVIESKEYWNHPLLSEYKDALLKMIELNKTGVDPAMEHKGILQPNTTVINQRLLIAECLQEVILGKSTPEKAAAKAHKKMEKLVAKMK